MIVNYECCGGGAFRVFWYAAGNECDITWRACGVGRCETCTWHAWVGCMIVSI